MTATIMDGRALAKKLTDDVKTSASKLSTKPCLAVVLVGDDPASHIYVKNKKKTAEELGMESKTYILPESTKEEDVAFLIDDLNKDGNVNGILVQLPLPAHINEQKIVQSISPDKDVDGFTYTNVAKLVLNEEKGFIPCTPQGIILLLKEYKNDLTGLNVCVVGRSNIVGRPLSVLLLQEDCSVDACHSKTVDLKSHCLNADIVIACVGKKDLITADMVKDGAIVIDIGINRLEGSKKICGDVSFDTVKETAGYITPVPGGVGPMTIACLMKNTLTAYINQQ